MSDLPHVYVFESDPAMATLLDEILTGEGHPVRILSPEELAAARVQADAPRLAVVEFSPERAARERSVRLIRQLREMAAPRQVAVLGLTGDYELVRRAATRFASIEDFALLSKPFGLDELLDVVDALLRYVADHDAQVVLDTPVPVLVTDRESRYLDANPAALALLGYSLPELRKLRVADVMEASERTTTELWGTFVRERGFSGDAVTLRRKDSSTVDVRVHASVIQGRAGREPLHVAWLRP